MTIHKTQENESLTLALTGRLDTSTAPQLEAEIKALPDTVEHLTLELSGLEYLSSAGLRVILAAQKKMTVQGEMLVKNVGETIMEVFDVTGFSNILTIV